MKCEYLAWGLFFVVVVVMNGYTVYSIGYTNGRFAVEQEQRQEAQDKETARKQAERDEMMRKILESNERYSAGGS